MSVSSRCRVNREGLNPVRRPPSRRPAVIQIRALSPGIILRSESRKTADQMFHKFDACIPKCCSKAPVAERIAGRIQHGVHIAEPVSFII